MPLINALRGTFDGLEALGRFVFTGGHRSLPTGLVFGRPGAGLRAGYNTAFMGGMPFIIAGTAAWAATAPRYHKAAAGIGAAVSPLGTVIGGLVAGPVGAVAGTFILDPLIQSTVAKQAQKFVEFGRKQRTLDFGGGFNDSETAWTMRQRAAQEMGRSLLNARHILGREAAMMHQ